MKKLFLILMIALISVFALASCGDGNDTPDGMQLAAGSEDEGYLFFVPEEWTVGSLSGINYAYISRVNTTSVSFTEVDPATFVKPDPAKSDESFFLEDYFNSTASEFPDSTKFDANNGQPCLLGSGDTKADAAVKYVYNYVVKSGYSSAEQRVGFMQIFAVNNGRFYILTYCASLAEKNDGISTYDYYLEKLQTVTDNIRFTDGNKKNEDKKEYPIDSDGDILASDKKLAGFSAYVPADFEVDFSSAIISATHADGSNITMTKATATGTTINNYWEFRKTELSMYVSNITDLGTNPRQIEFSNAKNAAACEYTYEYNGKTFHVYQIFAVTGGIAPKGYIFTYTALEENYSLHLDAVNRIFEKVEF